MENEFNQELIDYWRKIDIAILGIGSPTLKASESWKQFYGEDVLAYLEGKKLSETSCPAFIISRANTLTILWMIA